MSLSQLIRNAICDTYTRWHARPPVVSAPVSPPPAPPEPSCFVKGIAKSLVEEATRWFETESKIYRLSGYSALLCVRHADTGVIVEATTSHYGGFLAGCTRISSVYIDGHHTSSVEDQLIAQTLEAYPLGQLAKLIKADNEEAKRKAIAFDHFTNLGCPPSS